MSTKKRILLGLVVGVVAGALFGLIAAAIRDSYGYAAPLGLLWEPLVCTVAGLAAGVTSAMLIREPKSPILFYLTSLFTVGLSYGVVFARMSENALTVVSVALAFGFAVLGLIAWFFERAMEIDQLQKQLLHLQQTLQVDEISEVAQFLLMAPVALHESAKSRFGANLSNDATLNQLQSEWRLPKSTTKKICGR